MSKWADVRARSGLDKQRVREHYERMLAEQKLPPFRSGIRAGEQQREAIRAVFEQAEREGR